MKTRKSWTKIQLELVSVKKGARISGRSHVLPTECRFGQNQRVILTFFLRVRQPLYYLFSLDHRYQAEAGARLRVYGT